MAQPRSMACTSGLITHWVAPAKINRFLHVTGRREDGYHTLHTLFQFLTWHDRITITSHKADSASWVAEPAWANNLIDRAAALLQPSATRPLHCALWCDKKLPLGGGLGGGSSDAATTLVALNHLWQCHHTLEQLQALGLRLGADVPIFLQAQASHACGVGANLTLAHPPEGPVLLAIPPWSCSTPTLFSMLDNTEKKADPTPTSNDFEAVALALHPETKKWLHHVREQGFDVRMTGSGSVFVIFLKNHTQASRLQGELPLLFKSVVTDSVNTSPLMACAQENGVFFSEWGVAKW